jgi:two-component system sensor histidine kinase RegB
MSDTGPAEASSRRNLTRLFVLRSLMILVEVAAILAAHFAIGLELPLPQLFLIIVLLAMTNVWTLQRLRSGRQVRDREFFYQLSIDVAALAGLLYFTGGATNPFAWLFLIPLIIAATVLSATATWLMALITTACYSILMFRFVPLDSAHSAHSEEFAQHIFGMWFGFVLSAGLIAWFVVGMASTLRKRDRLLSQAREQALRDERLVALGTLATGAAHELGTPLATMAVVAHELERAGADEAVQRKARILREQVDRCKQALSIISASAGEARALGGGLIDVDTFLHRVLADWQAQRPEANIEEDFQPGPASAKIIDEYTLHQSLINLLNNAADASPAPLLFKASWNDSCLGIDILDRGPGLRPEVNARLGKCQSSSKDCGMGLGLFLTHATIQRLGGSISLLDREGGGTCTRINLPLAEF